MSMWNKTDISHIPVRDVVVDGQFSLIFTCPICGHEGWCYPGQAMGRISIICNGRMPNGSLCRWHETHPLMNYFYAQTQREAYLKRVHGQTQDVQLEEEHEQLSDEEGTGSKKATEVRVRH